MPSDDDATAELHMHDRMVWRHPLNKQSWLLCILYRQCWFSKADNACPHQLISDK